MAMNKLTSLTLLALAALLTGCSSAPAQAPVQASALTPQAARITDSRLLADRHTLEAVQQRLRRLSEAGIPQNNYPLAKAQCWLDTAKTQYHENDRTGYIEESLTESVKIVQALEADKTAQAGLETPLVARSTKLRDDLWAQLNRYKANAATLACNARTVACAEVRLVRAGHAEEQTGWRQATPHVQMAEDAVRQAGAEAASCPQAAPAPLVAVAPVPAPAPAAAPAAAPAPATRETFVLLADALFRFDKYGRDEMLPGGQQRLVEVAQRLKGYQSIQSLAIVGHTDRLGSHAYNDALSAKRAQTVKAALESLGVQAPKIETRGAGKRSPVTPHATCAKVKPRKQLIECLQADRRVTIEVTGVVK
jgi:OmpA-OmpF porin, OOP family